ncbi:LytTR family DNA-binding domain-containing protein [uncultured Clostridium sp.]|uniref:LytR/AlgR family response regulator transcription factor n=1 Tax=uncultured Clostridium sp. TaxID=59620 RepID=UPI00260CA841|nr:LytTR family DNA-binding domain-containing protein [uncultured Clostridium sp.]
MLNIAICDNEEVYICAILEILEEQVSLMNVKINFESYNSAEELLEVVEEEPLKYPIMFLDIFMDKMTGIELSRKVKELNKSIDIIFITSTKEFVFDAYDIGALNYILKPIDKNRLQEQFLRAVDLVKDNKKKFVIKKNSEIYTINISEIIYFEVRNRIIIVEYIGGKIEFYGKISDVEKVLLEYNFIKCHRAYIVNPKYIFKISSYNIVLKDERNIPVSRLKGGSVKKKFMEYIEK